MSAEIEFHDSTLSGCIEDGCDVVVHLRPAYVRANEDGVVRGYEQNVDLRFARGRILSWPTKLPVWISDAELKFGVRAHGTPLPMPHRVNAPTTFSGVTAESEAFAIEASALSVELIGERKFVEQIE